MCFAAGPDLGMGQMDIGVLGGTTIKKKATQEKERCFGGNEENISFIASTASVFFVMERSGKKKVWSVLEVGFVDNHRPCPHKLQEARAEMTTLLQV